MRAYPVLRSIIHPAAADRVTAGVHSWAHCINDVDLIALDRCSRLAYTYVEVVNYAEPHCEHIEVFTTGLLTHPT
jgi:hypothetical protein